MWAIKNLIALGLGFKIGGHGTELCCHFAVPKPKVVWKVFERGFVDCVAKEVSDFVSSANTEKPKRGLEILQITD
jgi:hypothetical protein